MLNISGANIHESVILQRHSQNYVQ